jgi:RDD family protein
MATTIDAVWICALAAVAYVVGVAVSSSAAPIASSLAIPVVIGLITLAEGGSRRASPGKHALRLVVADERTQMPIGYSRALLRVLGFAASGALLYLPLLGVLRRSTRQTWYDRSTRSIVFAAN